MSATDLLPLGAPVLAPIREAIRPPHGPGIELQHYELRVRVPAGAGDECYLAMHTHGELPRPFFIRRFPVEQLDRPMIEEVKRRGRLRVAGVEQVLELARIVEAGWAFVATDIVHGASLRDLYIVLHGRGERLPWSVAAVLAHDALVRLDALRAAGFVHPGITAPRIRISLWGALTLCQGDYTPRPAPPWLEVVWAALRPIFALAADDHERILLADLLAAPEPDALSVACDAIAERHPEVDPLLPLALVHRAAQAELAPLVDRVAVRRLWDLVIELATR